LDLLLKAEPQPKRHHARRRGPEAPGNTLRQALRPAKLPTVQIADNAIEVGVIGQILPRRSELQIRGFSEFECLTQVEIKLEESRPLENVTTQGAIP
jgi:hypothetical protein